MAIFKGAGVAIVTPMKENLDVNYEKLEEIINYQITNQTSCSGCCGNRFELHKNSDSAFPGSRRGRSGWPARGNTVL